MRMRRFIVGILLGCLCVPAHAQTVFHDAAGFPLLGKATQQSGGMYERFPDSLKSISRPPLWELSRNSAGLAVRFRSNTGRIDLKWEVMLDRHMNHMTDVGVKGLDLYCWEEDKGRWRYVNSARPEGKRTQTTVIADMKAEYREYMLYTPLYDGLLSLFIGVDSIAELTHPILQFPHRDKPVVFYGTSILQGGCASRPGMAHTNIISRRLNRECVNLGFSGNAFLDYEVAHIMAQVDAGIYVLDFVPNASVEQMEERMESFYRIIREKRPETPVLFVEDPLFTHTLFSRFMAKEVQRKNETLNRIFETLKEKGEKNIYLVSSEQMIGDDGEATVDGIHFTDVGMMRYADLVCPMIKALLE